MTLTLDVPAWLGCILILMCGVLLWHIMDQPKDHK